MDTPYVITIGRQLGSGGRSIGHLLADRLGIAYYDKEILRRAAAESGFTEELFERSDERTGFLHTLGNMIPFFGGSDPFYHNELSDENLFRLQSQAIQHAALEQSCLFIGRCADYVLRNHPRHVSVFISAQMPDRVQNVMKHAELTETEAKALIDKVDRKRAAYYNYYGAGKWGEAKTYDLCINSSCLGLADSAELILQFVKQSLQIETE